MRQAASAPLHVEWSVNEKIAYEVALAASYTGKRAAVVMKQVGLNVAADPFMRSAYLGVKGGLVVVVADDPGSAQLAERAGQPTLRPPGAGAGARPGEPRRGEGDGGGRLRTF